MGLMQRLIGSCGENLSSSTILGDRTVGLTSTTVQKSDRTFSSVGGWIDRSDGVVTPSVTNEFLPEPYLSKLSIFRLTPVHEVLVTYQGGYQEPQGNLILQQQ